MYDSVPFSMDSAPPILWLEFIPSFLFVYAIFPSFIIHFLINDFSLDLKAKSFFHFRTLYPAGQKRVGTGLDLSIVYKIIEAVGKSVSSLKGV
jgi:hypothetical protein